jgi:hypothetical protein
LAIAVSTARGGCDQKAALNDRAGVYEGIPDSTKFMSWITALAVKYTHPEKQ